MVVAMGSMGEVQMAGNQVINMVAVGNSLMAAGGAMAVARLVTATTMGRRAGNRVLLRDIQTMFVDMIAMEVMQVAVMQIIRVAVMKNGRMAAPGSMLMTMLIVNRMIAHGRAPFVKVVGS
ncbi:MAG: hypothetical protein NNA21_02325 [Nitrospira sp.]|nr:hypothetical protein [Nitrospira sp.]MCP9461606.1 hypothetical protein [Nitrospira sp.]MCP9474652.1 hypothetical protein [Nitrospira sp.]